MSDFGLEVSERQGVAVMSVTGSVDLTTAPELRERLLALIAEGHTCIVADLSQTDFLDSTGLGALVGALKRLRSKDGEIRLVCAEGQVRKVFAITRLDQVFSMHQTLEGALG